MATGNTVDVQRFHNFCLEITQESTYIIRGVCVQIRVADVISYLPKLTGTLSSDTGIGWKNPVSKTFLPKTKFRVGVSIVTICAALNNSRLGKPS